MNLTQRQKYPSRRPASHGFSILELLIALGLLGTLLALAWSILGSYRTAQQRGWDQTYRLRLAAAARDLLEHDALHFASRIPLTDQPTADYRLAPRADTEYHSAAASFEGSATGFTITTIASVDPLPWLEEVLGSGEPEPTMGIDELYRSTNQPTSLDTVNPLRQAPKLLPQPIRLRYAIQASDSEDTDLASANPTKPTNTLGTANAILVRTVAPPAGSSQANASSSSNTAADNPANNADRVLGLNDLYRQTELDDESISGVTTNSLRGLTAATFRYSDGNRWRSTWDSMWDGGLPRAIEFSFDYADQSAVSNNASIRDTPSPSDSGLANQTADGEIQRDVRIVVLVTAGQPAPPASTSRSSGDVAP